MSTEDRHGWPAPGTGDEAASVRVLRELAGRLLELDAGGVGPDAS